MITENKALTHFNFATLQKVNNQIAITNKVILHIKTKSYFDYLIDGFECSVKGDLFGAILNYTKSIEIIPENDVAYLQRSGAKLGIRDYKGALEDINKALEINPKNAESYYRRGLIYDSIQDIARAIENFTLAIEIDPKHAMAYYLRGAGKLVLGLEEEGNSDTKKAEELGVNELISKYS